MVVQHGNLRGYLPALSSTSAAFCLPATLLQLSLWRGRIKNSGQVDPKALLHLMNNFGG